MADKIGRKEGHRQVFEDPVNEIAETSKNASFLSDEDFLEIVKFLKGQNSKWSHSRSLGTRIKKHSYRLLDYPALGLKEVLCKPLDKTDAAVSSPSHTPLGSFKTCVKKSQLFDIIERVHCEEGQHAGYKKTFSRISEHYANVPRKVVEFFVKTCPVCNLRKVQNVKAPLKPIVTSNFMERCQIDLIDMRHSPDGPYNWIGHFMDHFSKYHVLFPLEDKSGPRVARMLRQQVLCYFGLPYIVQSDNGREFVNSVLEGLLDIWPGETQIINGRPRHPASQGLVEQGNYTLELMLAARKESTGENRWASWLPDFQYSLNTQVSASTGKQAYEIVFGQKPNYLAKLGIEGNVVLCEEDLDEDENENDHDGNDEDTQVTGTPAMKTSNPGESIPTNSTSHQFQTLDISQLQEVLDLNPVQATYQTIASNRKQAVEDKNQNSKRNKSDKTNQGTTSAIDSIIVNSHLDEIPMRTLDYQCVPPVSSLLGISTGSPPFISSKLTPIPSTKSSTVSSTKAPTVGESSSALVGSLLVNYSTDSNTISVKNTSTTLSKIDTNSPITSSPVSTALKRTPPVTSVETVPTFSTLSSPVMSLESFSSASAKLNPAIPVDSLSTSSTKSFPDLAESDSTALNLMESDPVTELKSTSLGLVRLSPVTLSGSSTVTFANLYSSSTGHSCDTSTVPNTTLPAVLSQDTFVRNETCNINSAATSVVNTESSCQENQTSPSEMIYSTSFTSTNSSPPAACSNSGVTTSVHNANKDGTELNLSGHTAHKSFHYHKTLISTKPVQTHNDSSSSDEELFAKASRKNFKLQDLDLFLVKIRDDGTMDSLFQNQNPLPKVVRVDQLSLDNQDELVHNLGELNDLYQDEMAHIDKFLLKHRPPLRQLSKDNCDVLVQVAHRVMEAFLSTLADNKQQSFVSSKQNQSVVTSPRRIKIREIVRKRGKENAEKMKSRYAKRKRIQVADFYVGQNVTVKIPKQDRTSTDNKRIECVIVGKKGEKSPPMYQLICRHGTLERWVTASEMLPYACPIQIPRDVIDSEKKLALSQAARLSSQTKELNYCKCKAHCKNNLCKCRKQLKVCSSRCHRGISCQNKTDQASSSREKSLSNKVSLTNNKPSDTSPISDDSGEDISESTSSDPSASPVTSSLQNLKGADCPDTSQILTFNKTSQHSGKHQPLVSNSAIEIVKKLMQKVQDASTRPIHQNEEQGSSCQPLPTSSFSDHQQDDSGLQLEQCVSIAQYDTISQVSSLSCTKSTTNINKSFLKPVATVNVQSLDLPHFGGQFKLKSDSPVVINLANTCPVDTWLMFLKALCIKDFDTFKKIIDISVQAKSSLSDVLQCVQNSQYTQAKCILAALNRTKIINRTINLFDSEHQVVLRHISVLKHTQTSNCSSEYCKERSKINTNSETPSISTTSQVDRDNFSSQVCDWLLGAFESTCGRKLDDTIYPPEAFFVDEQTDGKGQQQSRHLCCAGKRVFDPRQFCYGLPLMLPVSVDYAIREGKLFFEDIPECISMDYNCRYKLLAVSLWNGSDCTPHYTGLIKFNGCWYFYDGAMTPHPRLFPVTDLPKESIPSYCLYILESDVP